MTLRGEKGQGLVEFALVAPILLLLLIGIAEFGRAWMARNILTGAAREAARVAAVNSSVSAATDRANTILSSAGITSGATVAVTSDNVAFGTVIATVTYNFPVAVVGFVPGLAGRTITLSSATSMRREF